jgi:hypothetical protein
VHFYKKRQIKIDKRRHYHWSHNRCEVLVTGNPYPIPMTLIQSFAYSWTPQIKMSCKQKRLLCTNRWDKNKTVLTAADLANISQICHTQGLYEADIKRVQWYINKWREKMLKHWRCGPITTEIRFHPNPSMNMGGRVVFHLCFYIKY